MAQSELVNKYCSISNASKLKVLSALTEDRSMTSIARENNVSDQHRSESAGQLFTPIY
jgi:transposase